MFLLQHERDLKAFIGSLVKDRHVRDDIYQESVLILWRKFSAYDRGRSFGAWARGIAANLVMQRKQADSRFPCVFVPEAIRSVLDAYERTESTADARAAFLAECVEDLPAEQRDLLDQRYKQDAKSKDIAAASGRSLEAIYQALSRIRARLETCIQTKLNMAQQPPARTRTLADGSARPAAH